MNKSRTPTTFLLTFGDGRKATDLLAAGKYDSVDKAARRFVNSKRFRVARKPGKVKIELVKFNYPASTEEVLCKFESHGLELPTAEDALRFGEKYPQFYKKSSIAFLHKPFASGRRRALMVLCLGGFYDGRELGATELNGGGPWHWTFRFAARRVRK